MPQHAGEEVQVRLTKKNTKTLKRMTAKTRRSLTQEANLAVQEHVHRHRIHDNGK